MKKIFDFPKTHLREAPEKKKRTEGGRLPGESTGRRGGGRKQKNEFDVLDFWKGPGRFGSGSTGSERIEADRDGSGHHSVHCL